MDSGRKYLSNIKQFSFHTLSSKAKRSILNYNRSNNFTIHNTAETFLLYSQPINTKQTCTTPLYQGNKVDIVAVDIFVLTCTLEI